MAGCLDHLAKVGFLVILTVTLITVNRIDGPQNCRIQHSVIPNAEQTEEELKKRSDTLVSVIETTIQIIIIFIFLLMILSEFDN